jgi:hypothetical protein
MGKVQGERKLNMPAINDRINKTEILEVGNPSSPNGLISEKLFDSAKIADLNTPSIRTRHRSKIDIVIFLKLGLFSLGKLILIEDP